MSLPHDPSTTEAAAQAAEQVAISVGSKSAYAGAVSSVVGWLTSSEAAVLIGILVGVVGLAVQAAATWRREVRETREHTARMRLLDLQADQIGDRQ